MIGYLKGHLLEVTDGKLLIGIGSTEQGCVGYSVTIPQAGIAISVEVGQVIELFIYSHIREDAFDLYGFQTQMEKELFLTLLSVNGIGPKSALGILSAVPSYAFVAAVMREDQAFLTKIPGIGKKTAERAVLELRDPVRKKVELGLLRVTPTPELSQTMARTIQDGVPSVSGSDAVVDPVKSASKYALETRLFMDAKEALLSLGYREPMITPVLRKVLDSTLDPTLPPIQTSAALVKAALKSLM
jgi:Holliday junction DNA helicase RuvA